MVDLIRSVFVGPAGWLNRFRLTGPRPRTAGRTRAGTVLFVSGEPNTPGHDYRVKRYAAAAATIGYGVAVTRCDELGHAVAEWQAGRAALRPDLVIIWRATWSSTLKQAVRRWKRGGARVVFDVDDYMFDPALAKTEIIDGIRSQSVTEQAVAEMYGRVNETFMRCDAGIAPTEPLARAMRRWGKSAFVLPNGFDEATYAVSRRAVAAHRARGDDGLVRIGYAAGSRTHQKDFAVAAPAVARLLRERPECRLVLFQAGQNGPLLLDIQEFPELDGLADRVEWRQLRPLRDLPEELARFDINLAPLEVGNPFCEAKSELKFFEAALVESCTIASPTVPFASAMSHGVTGMLATTTDEWYSALRSLVVDPVRRRAMGRNALLSVLWRFGPDGRRQAASTVYGRLLGDPIARTREFAFDRLLAGHPPRLPTVPDTHELFRHESGGLPDVAVVIPCYNYGRFVVEALDSVAAQTEGALELIVVDDCSTDDSVQVVGRWMRQHARRFRRALHLRNTANSRLSLTRNAGFCAAEAPLVFPLDADNVLTPDCLALLRDRIVTTGAAAAHPTLVRFGGDSKRLRALPWDPDRLKHGNYIDAMALIRRSAWSHVGGYESMPLGWEDFDFWCLCVEAGMWSVAVPEATARYRVHGDSMLHSVTDVPENRRSLIEFLHRRHPWLDIPLP